jgi:hypothetical protein
MGNLSTSQKRGFNTLTILFSGLIGVTLGSLLGLLGGMLRWRLLARKKHTPLDVSLSYQYHIYNSLFVPVFVAVFQYIQLLPFCLANEHGTFYRSIFSWACRILPDR